jgi:GntR family transcriptional regulator
MVLMAVELGDDLTATTGRPLYEQVADDLRQKIRNAQYVVGDPLPSTAKLMEDYGVSITVARAAVRALQNEGLAIGQPGKGVFVRNVPDDRDSRGVDVHDRLDELAATVRDLADRVADLEKRRGRR